MRFRYPLIALVVVVSLAIVIIARWTHQPVLAQQNDGQWSPVYTLNDL